MRHETGPVGNTAKHTAPYRHRARERTAAPRIRFSAVTRPGARMQRVERAIRVLERLLRAQDAELRRLRRENGRGRQVFARRPQPDG